MARPYLSGAARTCYDNAVERIFANYLAAEIAESTLVEGSFVGPTRITSYTAGSMPLLAIAMQLGRTVPDLEDVFDDPNFEAVLNTYAASITHFVYPDTYNTTYGGFHVQTGTAPVLYPVTGHTYMYGILGGTARAYGWTICVRKVSEHHQRPVRQG